MKWVSILSAISVIICCFFPWVIIESKSIIISGVDSAGTNFGKPGYMNFFMAGIYFLLSWIPMLWAKRTNLFFAVMNLAWTFRNFILLGRCEGGECPVRQPALIIMLIASVVMLIALLFTPLSAKQGKETQLP